AWPNKQRMPNLLLVGPTNNGKSMIVEKFRRAHPVGTDADQEHIPVLVVQMPSEPSVIRFYVALLAAMGAPLRPRPRLPEMEQLALALLRKVGVRMLVIDELHNVLAGNSVNRREFLNLLRFLGNELLAHDLGHSQLDDLDTAPSLSLLTALCQRSGVELERLRSMSLAGWVPWLLDSLDDSVPAALETYTFQCAVLLPKRTRKVRSITRWRAWLPSQTIRRACPQCLNDPTNQAVLLVWQLPLMLSCPQHGCWLESYWGMPGRYLQWEIADAAPRPADDAIAC